MRRKYVPLGLDFTFGLIGVLATAGFSTSPSPSPSPAPTPFVARFGLIGPDARTPLTQAILDRYTSENQQPIAQAAAATIVPIATLFGQNLAGPNLCGTLTLSGYIEPQWHWHIDTVTATVKARLDVTDCAGNLYFSAESADTAKRDFDLIPQSQLDALEIKASADLVHKLTAFNTAHAALWNSLTRTGSITQPDSSSH